MDDVDDTPVVLYSHGAGSKPKTNSAQVSRGLDRIPRRSFCMMPAIRRTGNGRRPVLRQVRALRYRESTGRVIVVMAAIEPSLEQSIGD